MNAASDSDVPSWGLRYEYALSLLMPNGNGGFVALTKAEQKVVEECIEAAVKRRRGASVDLPR